MLAMSSPETFGLARSFLALRRGSSRARSQRCPRQKGLHQIRASHGRCASSEPAPRLGKLATLAPAALLGSLRAGEDRSSRLPVAAVAAIWEGVELSEEVHEPVEAEGFSESVLSPRILTLVDENPDEVEEIYDDGSLGLLLPLFAERFLQRLSSADCGHRIDSEDPCLIEDLDFDHDFAAQAGALVAAVFSLAAAAVSSDQAKEERRRREVAEFVMISEQETHDSALVSSIVMVSRELEEGANRDRAQQIREEHRRQDAENDAMDRAVDAFEKSVETARSVKRCARDDAEQEFFREFEAAESAAKAATLEVRLGQEEAVCTDVGDRQGSASIMRSTEHLEVEKIMAEVERANGQQSVSVYRSGPYGADSSPPIWHSLIVECNMFQTGPEPVRATRMPETSGTKVFIPRCQPTVSHKATAAKSYLPPQDGWSAIRTEPSDISKGGASVSEIESPLPSSSPSPSLTRMLPKSIDPKRRMPQARRTVIGCVARKSTADHTQLVDSPPVTCLAETILVGSPARALRPRRAAKCAIGSPAKSCATVFALDAGEALHAKVDGTIRESSLARGYEALAATEWHSMNCDDDNNGDDARALGHASAKFEKNRPPHRSPSAFRSVEVRPATSPSLAGCRSSPDLSSCQHLRRGSARVPKCCSRTAAFLDFPVGRALQPHQLPKSRAASAGSPHSEKQYSGQCLRMLPPPILKGGDRLAERLPALGAPGQRFSNSSRGLPQLRRGLGHTH